MIFRPLAVPATLAALLALAACQQDATPQGTGTEDAPAATDAAAADGTDSVAHEVRTNALGVVAKYNAMDPVGAAAYDAPDYIGIYHGSPNTVGPDADAAAMKGQMEMGEVNWDLDGEGRVTVAEAGDLAVFEAPYTFTVKPTAGGETVTESGNWVAIFKRQPDGTMKLWRSIASDTPGNGTAPEATPTPE